MSDRVCAICMPRLGFLREAFHISVDTDSVIVRLFGCDICVFFEKQVPENLDTMCYL